MKEEFASDFRHWIRDVKTEFGGEFPSNWPDAMVVLPYWQDGYSPKEFVEAWRLFVLGSEE